MVQFQFAGGRYKSHHHAFAIFGQIEKPLLWVLRVLTSCNFTRFLLTHCLLLLKVYIWKWVLSPFNVSLENQLDLERNLEKGEFLRLPGTDPQLIATFCLMLWTWTRFNLIVYRDALNLWAFALHTPMCPTCSSFQWLVMPWACPFLWSSCQLVLTSIVDKEKSQFQAIFYGSKCLIFVWEKGQQVFNIKGHKNSVV